MTIASSPAPLICIQQHRHFLQRIQISRIRAPMFDHSYPVCLCSILYSCFALLCQSNPNYCSFEGFETRGCQKIGALTRPRPDFRGSYYQDSTCLSRAIYLRHKSAISILGVLTEGIALFLIRQHRIGVVMSQARLSRYLRVMVTIYRTKLCGWFWWRSVHTAGNVRRGY